MGSLTLYPKDQILEEMPKERILPSTPDTAQLSVARLALPGRFLADESGQDLIEYALVGALLAVAVAAAVTTLGNKIGTSFNSIGNSLTNAI
jgi:pilus assembly protein Flp/PilA